MSDVMVIIKPHAVPYAGAVLYHLKRELRGEAEHRNTFHVESVPLEVIQEHYAEHRGKPFFQNLIDQFLGKPTVLGIYTSNYPQVYRWIREIAGPTDPAEARKKEPDTIRALFTDDSLDLAKSQKRALNNVIHTPDSIQAAQREMQIWEQFLR